MYIIISLETGDEIVTYNTYQECVDWIENNGNILQYTIVEK